MTCVGHVCMFVPISTGEHIRWHGRGCFWCWMSPFILFEMWSLFHSPLYTPGFQDYEFSNLAMGGLGLQIRAGTPGFI